MEIVGVVLAAGSGDRFGGARRKAFVELAGVPILVRSAATAAAAGIDRLVVVVRDADIPEARALLANIGPALVEVVAGGATRIESTRLGLEAMDGTPDDIVVVHDAARPLASVGLFRNVIAAVVAGADAASPVIASADTVARLEGSSIVEVPARATLQRVQTPQAFRSAVLRDAHRAALDAGDVGATDDCGLVLRHRPGARVIAIPGEEANLKITRPLDLEIAERLLAGA